MIGPIPILNNGWLQLGVSIYTQHDQAVPPVPAPAPAVPGLLEGPVPMGWPPGMISHKVAKTVHVDGNPAIQHGHDIGYLIPHIAMPMNALSAVHTLLSKHKIVFPVSHTKAENKPLGVYLFLFLGEICCNPVSMPTGILIVLRSTTMTSMSFMDLFTGFCVLAIDFVFDKIWNKLKGYIPRIPGQKYLQVLGGLALGEMITEGGGPLVAKFLLRESANKIVQHVIKSWVVSPLVTGLPFGKSGIGRGNWAYRSFWPSHPAQAGHGPDAHH